MADKIMNNGNRYEIVEQNDKEVSIKLLNEIKKYRVVTNDDIKSMVDNGEDVCLAGCYINNFSYLKMFGLGSTEVWQGELLKELKSFNNFNACEAFFDGKVDFSMARFSNGNVNFSRADFGDGDVDFSGAVFGNGNVDFSDSEFGDGNMNFERIQFGNGFVDFSMARFGNGDVSFQYTNFGDGDISFFTAKFGDGNLDFTGAMIGDGEVNFQYTEFGNSNVKLSVNKFGKGDVNFQCAQFGDGIVSFIGGYFGDGEFSFSDVKFGDGDVDFSGAVFGNGVVDYSGAVFGNGNVYFSNTIFSHCNVCFNYTRFDKGFVIFKSTKFGNGCVDFSDSQFNNVRLILKDLDIYGKFMIRPKSGEDMHLIVSNCYFSSPVYINIDHICHILFYDCTNTDLLSIEASVKYSCFQKFIAFFCFINMGTLKLKWNKIKESINNYNFDMWELNSNFFSKMIGELSSYEFKSLKADEYVMLKENFHNQGYYDWEDEAYVEFKKIDADLLIAKEKNVSFGRRIKHFPKYCILKILYYIGKYGTDPFGVFKTMILTVFVFGGAYYLPFVNIFPGDAIRHWWSRFYYSAITFFTIGYGDLSAQNGWAAGLCALEGFLGVFLMSYFSVALVRKILR